MSTSPQIKTQRLLLDQLNNNDIPKIVKYAGNKKVAEMTLNIPHPYEEEHAIYWINKAQQGLTDKSQYTFAIRLNTTFEFIGGIGLIVDQKNDLATLGYWIAEPFWGKGYATEATAGILRFGFEELQLNKIYATHLVENPASGKVMIKNKMIKEGELKDHNKKGDIYRSLLQYRLTKSEYNKIK